MRIPLPVRFIAGVFGAAAYVWALVLVLQGRYLMAFIIGALGTGCGSIAFAAMRESPY